MNNIIMGVTLVSGVISLYFLVYKPMNEFSLSLKENSMSIQNLSDIIERNEKIADNKFTSLELRQKELDRLITKLSIKVEVIEEKVGK